MRKLVLSVVFIITSLVSFCQQQVHSDSLVRVKFDTKKLVVRSKLNKELKLQKSDTLQKPVPTLYVDPVKSEGKLD